MGFGTWRDMIEFAEDIQTLVSRGWLFTRTYGEEKFGVYDSMVFRKGDEKVEVSGEGDLRTLCHRVCAAERASEWSRMSEELSPRVEHRVANMEELEALRQEQGFAYKGAEHFRGCVVIRWKHRKRRDDPSFIDHENSARGPPALAGGGIAVL